LHDALEAQGRLCVLASGNREIAKVLIDEMTQPLAKPLEIDATSPHHGRRVAIVDQREQEMLKGREFMAARGRKRKRTVQSLFELA
jgi:hypothetical protein